MDTKVENQQSAVIPAVSVPSSLASLRSLKKRDVHTIVVSEHDSTEAFCSRHCDERVSVPSPEQDYRAYKAALLDLAKRHDVRAILPFREIDIYVLSKYRDQFGKYIGTPFPTFEKLRRVQDRIRLHEAAEAAGIPTAETKLLTEVDDWSGEWVVKARYSILGDDYLERPDDVRRVITNRDTAGHADERFVSSINGGKSGLVPPPSTKYLLPDEEPNIDALCEAMGHVPLVQEYMPSTDEFGFFAIYDRGKPLATFQHRQIRGYQYSGGASAFRKSVRIPDLDTVGRKLLDHLDWHGPAMVEFKRDPRTGEFKLMEINPRFWSSLPFSVQAGADFPYYYWLMAINQQDRIVPGYEENLGGHLLMGELFYLRSVFGDDVPLVERPAIFDAVWEVLSSVVRHPRFDYLDFTDPCPFVQYASNHVRGGIKQRIAKLLPANSVR